MYDIIKVSVGRDINEKYTKELLRTVRFIKLAINTFNAQGWGDRGIELLLICEFSCPYRYLKTNIGKGNQPVTFYMSLYYARKESLNFLKESLYTPDFVLQPLIKEGRIPLLISSLVHTVMSKSVQYMFFIRQTR